MPRPILPQARCVLKARRLSSSLASLSADLPARQLPPLHDHLTPQPSYLLSTTLSSFLPSHSALNQPPPHLPPTTSLTTPSAALPEGHHLIYFPPPLSLPSLLPDGTDPAHSPGDPHTRRMWAGGRVSFRPHGRLRLDGRRAICVEGIRDVRLKEGPAAFPGSGKVFVGIERRIVGGIGNEDEALRLGDAGWRARLWGERGEIGEQEAAVVERRELVFMRDRPPSSGLRSEGVSAQQQQAAEGKPPKILRAPYPPTLSHTLIPTPHLLFRFSALTFNAHAIHLDSTFCRAVEGHRNLLVHGPLSLVLLLSFLRGHLLATKRQSVAGTSEWMIKEIEYRNLAPLYAEEEMRLCARPHQQQRPQTQRKDGDERASPSSSDTEARVGDPRAQTGTDSHSNSTNDEEIWDLWIEGPDGGMCVRGRATVGRI
ncbi:MAG: hypothetical protein M1837_001718 [Sclerophora amabilis]|nr:MAG: hypothetical protein M1837_001718 [Sclerophora amabilis]